MDVDFHPLYIEVSICKRIVKAAGYPGCFCLRRVKTGNIGLLMMEGNPVIIIHSLSLHPNMSRELMIQTADELFRGRYCASPHKRAESQNENRSFRYQRLCSFTLFILVARCSQWRCEILLARQAGYCSPGVPRYR